MAATNLVAIAAIFVGHFTCILCGYFYHFDPHRYHGQPSLILRSSATTGASTQRRSSITQSAPVAVTTPTTTMSSSALLPTTPTGGSTCVTKEGVTGICRSIQNCSHAIDNFYRVQLTICTWRGHVPVVCCPDRPAATPSPRPPPRPQRPFSMKPLIPVTRPTSGNVVAATPAPVVPQASSLVGAPPILLQPPTGGFTAYGRPRPAVFPTKDFSIQTENGSLTFKIRSPAANVSENGSEPLCGVQTYEVNPSGRQRSPSRFRPNSKDPDTFHYTSSIVGGTEVAVGSFPWMAAIFKTSKIPGGTKRSFLCGGSIVNSRHIITAAHCFQKNDDASMFQVRLGDHDLTTDDDVTPAKPEEVAVDKILLHPSYRPPQIYHDLALLRLRRPLALQSGGMLPICLPRMTEENVTYPEGTIAGWGSTQSGRPTNSVLHQVTLPVVSNRECDKAYGQVLGMSLYFPEGISDNLLCAGFQDGGKDACQGDSGGPMMVLDAEGRWTLFGVVSVGRGCAEPGFPGLYTRIQHYAPWIVNQTTQT